MKIVIAANHAAFINWCRENDVLPGKDAYYVSRQEDIAGLELDPSDIVRVSGHYLGGEHDAYLATRILRKEGA